jgi:hypothetical protein
MFKSFKQCSGFELELQFVLRLCETVNTPKAIAFFMLMEAGEYSQALGLSFSPLHYLEHQHFADDYLIMSCLKKSPSIPLGINTRDEAVKSFRQSESECAEVNRKVYSGAPLLNLQKVKNAVHSILGPLTGRDLLKVENSCKFGPGANAFRKAQGSVPSDKYDGEIHLTEELYPFYKGLVGKTWWDNSRPITVPGNEFTTVSKSAKTDRGICKEPALNSFMQLGIGCLLKHRLLRAGIDLSDQLRNQMNAQLAYSHGLCTIDLARASDSLAYGIVQELFPRDWLKLLDICRSPRTQLSKSEVVDLEKYSSMGNGYTFELESLIFLAICRACVPKSDWAHICVYGDDLIVKQEYAKEVIDTLNAFGFSVNNEKSYLAGNFFESCGADFFKGHPVRPFYLRGARTNLDSRETVVKGIPYAVQIANALRHYASRINYGSGCDNRFEPLWRELVASVPRKWRTCTVCPTLGDVGIVTSLEEANFHSTKGGHEGVVVNTIHIPPIKRVKRTIGVYIMALSRAGSPDPTFTGGRQVRRGLFGIPKTKRVVVHRWTLGYEWQDC